MGMLWASVMAVQRSGSSHKLDKHLQSIVDADGKTAESLHSLSAQRVFHAIISKYPTYLTKISHVQRTSLHHRQILTSTVKRNHQRPHIPLRKHLALLLVAQQIQLRPVSGLAALPEDVHTLGVLRFGFLLRFRAAELGE